VLKRYASIRDIVRDLRKLRKSTQLIAANILEDDDDNTHPRKKSGKPANKPAASKPTNKPAAAPPPSEEIRPPLSGGVRMRRSIDEGDIAAPTSPGQRFRVPTHLKPAIIKSIVNYNKKLNALIQQRQSINHISHLLQTDFANHPDTANIDRMRQITKRIKEDVEKHILINEDRLDEITRDNAANDILFKLANNVSKKLTEMLGNKEKDFEQKALTAMVKNRKGDVVPQHTIYLIYHNLPNDVGHIFPQKIYALSLRDGELYLSTGEHIVRPPGQFPSGIQIDYHDKQLSKTTDEVVRHIKSSMTHDNLVGDIPAIKPPFGKSDVNPQSLEHVTNFDILPDGTMTLNIDKAVGNEAAAMDVVNKVHVHLNSALLLANPKSRARIIPSKPKKIPTGYSVILKLIPAGQSSGKTLSQKIAQYLENEGVSRRHIRRFQQIVQEE